MVSFADSAYFFYGKYNKRSSQQVQVTTPGKKSSPIIHENINFRDDLFAGTSKQANLLLLCNVIKKSDINDDSTSIVPFKNRCEEYVGIQWCHVNMLQYCAYPLDVQLENYDPVISHYSCNSSESDFSCMSYNMRDFPRITIESKADNKLFKLFFYKDTILIANNR